MERIQRNLEQFLQQDLQQDDDLKGPDRERRNTAGQSRRQTRTVQEEQPQLQLWQQEPDYRRREEDLRSRRRPEQTMSHRQLDDQSFGRRTDQEHAERQHAEKKHTGKKRAERKHIERKRVEQEPMEKRKTGKKRSGREHKEEQPKKKHVFWKVLLLLLVILAVIWYIVVSRMYSRMTYEETPAYAAEPLKAEGVYNVLLIGSDSRTQGDEGRSDAMILLSISKKTRTIQMVSLLRDMYVEIPGHDGNRLNAAYSFGGAELLMETVSQNLGIEVNRYVVVNFQAFANLIDAVGGVTLELSNDEVNWINAYLNEYNMLRGMPIDTDYLDTTLSGEIHLNGPQALAYCRNRYIGTDFGRTERQRKVLSAVIKKIPLAAVTKPGELIDGIFPNLTTNLTKGECMELSLQAGKLALYDLQQSSVPIPGSYSDAKIRGMAVLQVDFEANRQYLRQQIYGEGGTR